MRNIFWQMQCDGLGLNGNTGLDIIGGNVNAERYKGNILEAKATYLHPLGRSQ